MTKDEGAAFRVTEDEGVAGCAGELDGVGDLLWTALRKGRYNGLDLI